MAGNNSQHWTDDIGSHLLITCSCSPGEESIAVEDYMGFTKKQSEHPRIMGEKLHGNKRMRNP